MHPKCVSGCSNQEWHSIGADMIVERDKLIEDKQKLWSVRELNPGIPGESDTPQRLGTEESALFIWIYASFFFNFCLETRAKFDIYRILAITRHSRI